MIAKELTNRSTMITEIGMLLLATFPISRYYPSPLPLFSLGEVLMFIWAGYYFLKFPLKDSFCLPRYYGVFWALASISILLKANVLEITLFIPGGVSLFLYSILLGFSIKNINVDRLKFYLRIVAIVSVVIFIAQEIVYARTGVRFCAVIPFESTSYGDITYEELKYGTMYKERSSSIFMEPSYFAQYVLIFLSIDIFTSKQDKPFSYLQMFLIVILLFSRVGSAIAGLIVIVLYRILSFAKSNNRNSKLYTIFISILIAIGIYYYLGSETGSIIAERSNEFGRQESSGYIRSVQGFLIFQNLPFFNKLFGQSLADSMQMAEQSGIYSGSGMLANGFQSALISLGLIGFSVLLFVYILGYRNSTILGKSSIVLLLAISMIEANYLAPSMLLLSAIAFSEKNKVTNSTTI